MPDGAAWQWQAKKTPKTTANSWPGKIQILFAGADGEPSLHPRAWWCREEKRASAQMGTPELWRWRHLGCFACDVAGIVADRVRRIEDCANAHLRHLSRR